MEFFFETIEPYANAVTALAPAILAIYTIILARIARQQNRDLRITQRAYLDVRFGGISLRVRGRDQTVFHDRVLSLLMLHFRLRR
jgi:hypothetical protein